MVINHFGSLWRLKFNDDVLYGELLFTLLRQNGIHIWDGFPCFLTEPYQEEDVNTIINAIKNGIDEMISAGFFLTSESKVVSSDQIDKNNTNIFIQPPVAGAKGRDKDGNPAWYTPSPTKVGEFVKVEL
jgi:hypothetical protein